jgi:hypothetical protein
MAYIYSHYEKGESNGERPFYIGISNQDFIEDEQYTGSDPNEAIEHFVNKPYIRMYDFGPKSHHGFKAKLSFENCGDKSDEYQEYIKDKIYGKDYFAKVLFETDNIETINFLEYMLVKRFGFRHDGGILFNKINGGCKLINGKLEYQFSFNYLLSNLNDYSLVWNPDWNFVNEDKNIKFSGSNLTNKVISISQHQDMLTSYKDRISELEKELQIKDSNKLKKKLN